MAKPDRENYTDAEIHDSYVDAAPELNSTVTLHEYDPEWVVLYEREAERIRAALGETIVSLEHVGSTSVPGLCAKPVIDVLLVVPDSGNESAYLTQLEHAGYRLVIREPDWEQHRCFKGTDPNVNLHVLSPGSREVERYRLFRDRLRTDTADRDLYARTKRELAARTWSYIQHYADAKNAVVDEIIGRARDSGATGYDDFGEDYAEQAGSNPFNALYDRPAIMALAGTSPESGCSRS